MAVVTKYSAAHPLGAPTNPPQPPDAVDSEGKMHSVNGSIVVTNGDSSGSKYYLGRVPSHSRIAPNSWLYFAALTGVTSAHVGFANSANALLNAADLHLAGNIRLTTDVEVANLGKRAWELAGLTADPGGMLDVILTINADAGATGAVHAALKFADKN
jgi:hypothetical protein